MSAPTSIASSPPGKNKRRPAFREAFGRVAVRFWFGRYAYTAVISYILMLGFFWISAANLPSGSAASIWAPPNFRHMFGTNAVGLDVMHVTLAAGAKPLTAAILAAMIGVGISVLLSCLVALSHRSTLGFLWLDRVTRYTGFLPALLGVLIISAAWGAGFWKTVFLFSCIVVATTLSKVGEWFEDLEERGDTIANTVLGLSRSEIIRGNYVNYVAKRGVALACGIIPCLVLGETALSFVGFGIGSDTWGGILALGHEVIFEAPWLVIYPGIVVNLSLIALAISGWLARKSMAGEIPPRIF